MIVHRNIADWHGKPLVDSRSDLSVSADCMRDFLLEKDLLDAAVVFPVVLPAAPAAAQSR
jgi:hypothetical protein